MAAKNKHRDDKQALRVLVLATSYPLGAGDSSSIFLKYLCQHLQKQGASVHVLAPAATSGGLVNEDGILVHRFRYMFKPWQKLCYGSGILPNLKQNPLLWLLVPWFLSSFLVASIGMMWRVRPDVVHGHWVIPTGVIGLLASLLFDRPFIISAHGGDAFSIRSGLMSRLKKFVINKAQAWTANTAATAQAIDAGQGDTLHLIPMGVDTDRFAPVANGQPVSEGVSRILFVGRLVEKKGVSVLIDAIAALPDQSRNSLQVDIVGDGAEKPALINQARSLGIDKLVEFHGHIPNQELPGYFQRATLFVGPSVIDATGDTEGQGVVFLEAMAAGTPVIASDVGGIGEVIEHEVSGLLVPVADPDALAAAITRLLENDSLRQSLAGAARLRVVGQYSWGGVASQFMSLYRKLVSPGRTS